MNIPLVDLQAQYSPIKSEIDSAIQEVLSSCAFIGGKQVRAFEEEFAAYIGAAYCISCGNGTDALQIALKSLGIGAGDEVIVPANSFIATSEAVTNLGAKVVFADVDDQTSNIDATQIEQKITGQTKAMIAVHLYGLPADMQPILDIAKKHHLYVIEDAAQAHGAVYHGKKIGTIGDIATFSFYPGKNLGAYGDAGAIVTDNEDLAVLARKLANHGRIDKYNHQIEGYNSRLDGIQAAILSVKLKYIEEWTALRIQNAGIYTQLLRASKIKTPYVPEGLKHVFHLYVIETINRNELLKFLEGNDIQAGIHYPIPLPLLQAYKYLGHSEADFPVVVQKKENILSLPMYPELKQEQIEYIVEKVLEFERTHYAELSNLEVGK